MLKTFNELKDRKQKVMHRVEKVVEFSENNLPFLGAAVLSGIQSIGEIVSEKIGNYYENKIDNLRVSELAFGDEE